MPIHDELGTRMKKYYESIPKTKLMRKCPVAIRCDGKSFHTFTKGFQKPFDQVLINAMQQTMKYLCENIQGCVLGYTQSDEITLILQDYKEYNTDAWFDYEVQKMCSITASMATMAFNKYFSQELALLSNDIVREYQTDGETDFVKDMNSYLAIYSKVIKKGAMFDARCFSIPKEEVANLLYWRQLDATRNSIQMVGQSNFSHRELQNKSCAMIQEMLFTQKGVDWNDYPTYLKRGSCCIKEVYYTERVVHNQQGSPDELEGIQRTHWVIDENIPIFKNEGREYIEKLINFD